MRFSNQVTKKVKGAIIIIGLMVTTNASALLDLNDNPLFLLNSVEPNILLTFDDSGSMAWGYLPDGVGTLDTTKRGCANNINHMAYDPATTYSPGVDAFGTSLGNASFSAAWISGYNQSGGTVNLSTSYRPVWSMNSSLTSNSSYASCATTSGSGGQQAFYYVYDTTLSTCTTASTSSDSCYRRVDVSATSGPGGTDERQNFANWYSYYRVRSLMARTAVGRVFGPLGTNIRVAAQHLNNTTTTTTTPRFTTTIGAMAPFTSTARTDFFTRLYNAPANNSTPLRTAMQRAGDYFSTAGPYQDTPGASLTTSPELACRQNFHVLMTDGYWNGGIGRTGNIDGTSVTLPDGTMYTPTSPYTDDTSDTLADNAFYYWSHDLRPALANKVPPYFADTITTTPSKYWNPKNDPATWQHMVNFTIGLGIDGKLAYPAAYSDLLSGAKTWSAACATCTGENVDDLWHAAIDSRGRYFSASNPNDLVKSFGDIIGNISSRAGSAAAVTMNTGSYSASTNVYQSRFHSDNWSGQLFAYNLTTSSTGLQVGSTVWEASSLLNSVNFNSRQIITYNTATHVGVPFRWTDLSTSPTQVAALNTNATGVADASGKEQGAARLDYLRGSSQDEGKGNNYRVRTCYDTSGNPLSSCLANGGRLGDVIDSGPLYQGPPAHHYPDQLESSSYPYSTFASNNQSRSSMLYVGANDGMLHAFDAQNGNEKFAYVPAKVYRNLSALTGVPYKHRYYVDGPLTTGDAFLTTTANASASKNSSWRTVLVGGLRKGGQGYFALDVTDPTTFKENNANDIAMWEFTDEDDADLGYSYGQASIVKMANGKWAAIFGNGYNSDEADGHATTSGNAVLYIVFIEDGVGSDKKWAAGTNFIKIDTGVGGNGTFTANGLASPSVVDVDGDNIADFIYAGDLRGNLWKFDVTSATASDWAASANRRVLFAAKDASGKEQPITSSPMIGRHPDGLLGYMVYFGTGKYLETSDATPTGSTTQTFYGVWDKESKASKMATPPITPPASPTRAKLLQQTVIGTTTTSTGNYRLVSNNAIVWQTGTVPPTPSYLGWYIDLPTTGERQVTDSNLRDGKIIFTTLIPSSDRCEGGGTGWLMELGAINGGQLSSSPFDVTGDGVIDSGDKITVGAGSTTVTGTAGGQQSSASAIPAAPAILAANPSTPPGGPCVETKFISGSDGSIMPISEACSANGRRSWRQLR